MQATEKAVKKAEPGRRGSALPAELRDFEKLVEAFAETFSFARGEVDRLKRKAAIVIEAWQKADAQHRAEHRQVRAKLNTMFNGRIEKWIYGSSDEEMKAFFRRVWKD